MEYLFHKTLTFNDCVFAAETMEIFQVEITRNSEKEVENGKELKLYIDGVVPGGDNNSLPSVCADCLIVLHNYHLCEDTCKSVQREYMSFQEFISSGASLDLIEFNNTRDKIQIIGSGRCEDNETKSLYLEFSFTSIELFWNGEYDYMTGNFIRGLDIWAE